MITRNFALRLVLSVCWIVTGLAACFAATAGPALAAEPVLKRVVLSSGGVGYFEYEAEVSGNAELTLPVRLDQVDDILKSVVILDNKGGVGTIRLQSQSSVDEIFRDLPFGPHSLTSMAALLEALKGAEIDVRGPDRLAGRIATVEGDRVVEKSGTTREIHRVGVMTSRGLKHFVLEKAGSVKFTDKVLNAKVNAALEKMMAQSGEESRTLLIRSDGTENRTLTIGYVVEVPLWKSSYRLVVPSASESAATESEDDMPQTDRLPKGRLQGWAIVDNASGQDWRDVNLTLVSGNPVTFRQSLYATYYVKRPEVPLEVMGKILPKPDEGAVGGVMSERKEAAKTKARATGFLRAPSPAETYAEAEAMSDMAAEAFDAIAPAAEPLAASSEGAAQVEFTFKDHIRVDKGQSIVVPTIDRNLPAERVALFDPQELSKNNIYVNPLAAVRVMNDTATSLPPGSVTLYEAGQGGALTFIGDARIKSLPKGEFRLISYALDSRTHIERSRGESSREVRFAKLVGGILQSNTFVQRIYKYDIKAPEGEGRRIILVNNDQGTLESQRGFAYEKSAGAYRIYVNVPAGAERKLELGFHDVLSTETRFVEIGDNQIPYYFSDDMMGFITTNVGDNEDLKASIDTISSLKTALQSAKDDIDAANRVIDRIYREQERIRENIKALDDKGSAIYRRYLDKLNQQEDLLEESRKVIDEAMDRQTEGYRQLRDVIRGLDFEIGNALQKDKKEN